MDGKSNFENGITELIFVDKIRLLVELIFLYIDNTVTSHFGTVSIGEFVT